MARGEQAWLWHSLPDILMPAPHVALHVGNLNISFYKINKRPHIKILFDKTQIANGKLLGNT